MFPPFLPQTAVKIKEPAIINLLQDLQRIVIPMHLYSSQQDIATTYIHQGSGKTPILLFHGFNSSVLEFRRLLPLLAKNQEV